MRAGTGSSRRVSVLADKAAGGVGSAVAVLWFGALSSSDIPRTARRLLTLDCLHEFRHLSPGLCDHRRLLHARDRLGGRPPLPGELVCLDRRLQH
mgnify:CR=1 FL=1